jgi:hypothetical protein
MLCEGVQHHLRFGLDHLNCVKRAAFQFYFQPGKERKVSEGQDRQVERVGDNSHVVFGQNILCENGCVKRCNS